MFWIETLLSIFTLSAMFMLRNGHRVAPILGVVVNSCWVINWLFITHQYGFLFLDAGIAYLYWDTLIKQLKGEW